MSSIFKNKKGLGRGLSSLIGDSKTVSKNNKISVSDLIRNRYQPRKTFNEEFSYDVQSDKFNMAQYVDNITENLNTKISNDIIFLLGTLK